MKYLTNILWDTMADLTVIVAMEGLTNVLWATMACGRRCLTPPSPVGADG